jgi:hypothetical protein
MADLKLKCVMHGLSTPSAAAWKYEIYREGDKEPYSIGYYYGTRAEAEAIALQAQQRFLDEWKRNGQ